MPLSDDKKAELKDAFSEIDTGKTGKLGLDAVGECLSLLGLAPAPERIKELLGGNTAADFDAFVGLYEKCESEEGALGDDVEEMWTSFDKDGSGAVKGSDLVHILKTLGEAMSDEDAKKAIAEADKDGDGYITKEEFVALMAGA